MKAFVAGLLVALMGGVALLSAACDSPHQQYKFVSPTPANNEEAPNFPDSSGAQNRDDVQVLTANGSGTPDPANYRIRSGVLNWWYNPAGQPANVSKTQALAAITAAAENWQKVCGIRFSFQGETKDPLNLNACGGKEIVSWQAMTGRTVGLINICYDRDPNAGGIMQFNIGLDNRSALMDLDTIQAVAGHEFGHAFGLEHVFVAPALMTPLVSTVVPQQSDIEACRSIYGVPGGSGGPVANPPPETPEEPRSPAHTPSHRPSHHTDPHRRHRRGGWRVPTSCRQDLDCGESEPGCSHVCDTSNHCSTYGTTCEM